MSDASSESNSGIGVLLAGRLPSKEEDVEALQKVLEIAQQNQYTIMRLFEGDCIEKPEWLSGMINEESNLFRGNKFGDFSDAESRSKFKLGHSLRRNHVNTLVISGYPMIQPQEIDLLKTFNDLKGYVDACLTHSSLMYYRPTTKENRRLRMTFDNQASQAVQSSGITIARMDTNQFLKLVADSEVLRAYADG